MVPIPTPTRPIVFSRYEPASLGRMADILRRASRGRTIDEDALEANLLNVIHATGIGREDTQASAVWHEEKATDHLEMARAFAKMAEAPNPLDAFVCTDALKPELNGKIINIWSARWRKERRNQPASIRNVIWENLTALEQVEIREMARSLSAFHRSLARPHRPTKDDIDTVLFLLAEIFADHTGYDRHPTELPHSVSSRFILFAHEALKGFFDPSEITHLALARRWQRQKEQSRRA